MTSYIIRRMLLGMLTLLLITFLVYGLLRNMPGSPLTALQGEDLQHRFNPVHAEQLKAQFALDKPWQVAYFYWLWNVVRGDFGISFQEHRTVLDVLWIRLPATLMLAIPSLALSYIFSVPLGLYSTARSDKFDERFLSVVLYALYSLPVFVAALLLQATLAVHWRLFPLVGLYGSAYDQLSFLHKIWDVAWHLALPVAVETYGVLAYYSRFIRSNMLEVMQQDYIRTARAKGVGPVRVIWHHAFRNTLIPFVTLLGMTLPALISGSIVIEEIFALPGTGRLFFQSVTSRDYAVTMGLTLMFSVFTLLGNLLADVLYAVVDPRISYS